MGRESKGRRENEKKQKKRKEKKEQEERTIHVGPQIDNRRACNIALNGV